jgi:protein-S-isoprenylcysteine O-methyltransferase Ste14
MTPRRVSIAATILLVACIVALLERHELLARHRPGMVAQGAAVMLMLWARWTFGRRSFHAAADPTAGGLVTSGPYRYWRHPIYAAVLLFVWVGIHSQHHRPSVVGLLLAVAATLLTFVRMLAEERLLRATFPEYDGYALRTKRIIPFVL